MLGPTPNRVLLIEDDKSLCGTLEQWVWRIWPGVIIRPALSLVQALTIAEQFHPQMVLADLNLPDSPDPTSTVLALTGAIPSQIPIVIISGYVSTVDRLTYLAMGCDAVLAKDLESGFFATLCATLASSWARTRGRLVRHPTQAEAIIASMNADRIWPKSTLLPIETPLGPLPTR